MSEYKEAVDDQKEADDDLESEEAEHNHSMTETTSSSSEDEEYAQKELTDSKRTRAAIRSKRRQGLAMADRKMSKSDGEIIFDDDDYHVNKKHPVRKNRRFNDDRYGKKRVLPKVENGGTSETEDDSEEEKDGDENEDENGHKAKEDNEQQETDRNWDSYDYVAAYETSIDTLMFVQHAQRQVAARIHRLTPLASRVVQSLYQELLEWQQRPQREALRRDRLVQQFCSSPAYDKKLMDIVLNYLWQGQGLQQWTWIYFTAICRPQIDWAELGEVARATFKRYGSLHADWGRQITAADLEVYFNARIRLDASHALNDLVNLGYTCRLTIDGSRVASVAEHKQQVASVLDRRLNADYMYRLSTECIVLDNASRPLSVAGEALWRERLGMIEVEVSEQALQDGLARRQRSTTIVCAAGLRKRIGYEPQAQILDDVPAEVKLLLDNDAAGLQVVVASLRKQGFAHITTTQFCVPDNNTNKKPSQGNNNNVIVFDIDLSIDGPRNAPLQPGCWMLQTDTEQASAARSSKAKQRKPRTGARPAAKAKRVKADVS